VRSTGKVACGDVAKARGDSEGQPCPCSGELGAGSGLGRAPVSPCGSGHDVCAGPWGDAGSSLARGETRARPRVLGRWEQCWPRLRGRPVVPVLWLHWGMRSDCLGVQARFWPKRTLLGPGGEVVVQLRSGAEGEAGKGRGKPGAETEWKWFRSV